MANRYWVGGTGTWNTTSTANWSTTSGGAAGASAPGVADVAIFNASSGAGVITLGETVDIFRATWVGYTGSFNPSTFEINVVGASATGVWSGGTTAIFLAIPTVNFTNNSSTTRVVNFGSTATDRIMNVNVTAGTGVFEIVGPSFVNNLSFSGYTGQLTPGDITINGNLTLGTGMTVGFSSNVLSFAQPGSKSITTNGVALDLNISFPSTASGGTWSFADALTQGSTKTFTIAAGTVKLKAGATSAVGSFVANSNVQKYLGSTLDGTQATLTQSTGSVNVSQLAIQDINATGGATWNAYVDYDNEDAGNNDGWNFGLSPPYETYEPPIIIRSFTQPRRF